MSNAERVDDQQSSDASRSDRLEALAKKASAEIVRISITGGRSWRMSIPARQDDSDLLLHDLTELAIDAADHLRRKGEALRQIGDAWKALDERVCLLERYDIRLNNVSRKFDGVRLDELLSLLRHSDVTAPMRARAALSDTKEEAVHGGSPLATEHRATQQLTQLCRRLGIEDFSKLDHEVEWLQEELAAARKTIVTLRASQS